MEEKGETEEREGIQTDKLSPSQQRYNGRGEGRKRSKQFCYTRNMTRRYGFRSMGGRSCERGRGDIDGQYPCSFLQQKESKGKGTKTDWERVGGARKLTRQKEREIVGKGNREQKNSNMTRGKKKGEDGGKVKCKAPGIAEG